MTDDIEKVETDFVEITSTQEDLFIEGLNDKITDMIAESMGLIEKDRKRAESTFAELRDIILNGETDPDTLRELNKSQENISTTTDQVIKVLAQLAKLKSGDTRIQIAQINEAKKNILGGEKITGKDILKAMEEMENEGTLDEDDSPQE